MIEIKQEALEAERRIRSHIRETPLEYSPYLSKSGNCRVFLKLENFQVTGSFKLRGAANKLLSLSKEEREKGIITASSGNHGAAIAYLLDKFNMKGEIVLPQNTSRAKIDYLRTYGTDMEFIGNDCVQSESFARERAQKNKQVFISPYNDWKVIGGQATIGIELTRQLKSIDAIFIPVGGGGLASGIAGYLKQDNKNIEIIGCQPENSPVMAESIKVGKIIEMESKPTLSDGTAGGLEKGAITFSICKRYIDDYVLISESEIRDSLRFIIEKHFMLIEGAAALSVASFLKTKKKFENKNIVLIISGSKISLENLKEVLG